MRWSEKPRAEPSRSPSMRVLGLLSSPPSARLENFGHPAPHALLLPVASSSNIAPHSPAVSPLRCTSPLELPPLPNPIPIIQFRDVVPYHLLLPDHPLDAPSSLSPHRSSPPAGSFDEALSFSQASWSSSASPVEPPLRCKELRSLNESDTKTPGEFPLGTSEWTQSESMNLSLFLA